MSHNVCATCKGTSENAGFCQTPDCAAYGEALKECNCEDEMHQAVVGGEASDESIESEG
jgi:hypothetical protein